MPSSSPFTKIPILVLLVAPLQTLLNALSQTRRDLALESSEVVSVDLAGEAESSINDIRAGVDEEVLGDGAGTWVLGVEASDTNGGLAVEVLLPVDGALREDCALVLGDGGVELVGLVILHHETGAHAELARGSEGEEFGGTGVDVGSVEATALEEDGGSGDAKGGQDGEVSALGEIDLTALTWLDTWVGGGVEVEVEGDLVGIETLSDDVEALDGVGCGQELANKVGGSSGVGLSSCDAQSLADHGAGSTCGVGRSASRVRSWSFAGIKRRGISDGGNEASEKN